MCSCEERKNRLKQIRDALEALPAAIQLNLEKRREQDDIKQANLNAMKWMEINETKRVYEEIDVAGKKVYTNQETRDTEVYRRLESDTSYVTMKKENGDAVQRIKEIDDTVEVLKLKFKAKLALIEIENMEGNNG